MIPENHLEFLHAVWTRRTPYTYFFFGLNIFLFILMAFAGGSTNGETLMAFGVKSNPEIAMGQWWRFVTPIFLHIGLLHIFFNSYALWVVGPQVEKLYGGARFVILYVLTGVASVASSYFYRPADKSAGASGAIFGLLGASVDCHLRAGVCRFRCPNATGEYRKGDADNRAERMQLRAALLHDKDMANEMIVF